MRRTNAYLVGCGLLGVAALSALGAAAQQQAAQRREARPPSRASEPPSRASEPPSRASEPPSRASEPPSRASEALFPSPPELERLPNGMRVVTVAWPSPGIVAYYTMMRVGSRDEVEAGHSGFAHFFEHMMFRGTPAHSQHDYEQRLQAFGADNNAFTTSDYTCYTITAPSAALPVLIELEADRFQNLAYEENVFRTEAGAVRGEYQVWSSRPDQPMWEALSELAFSRHTYRHTTIGYLRDIEAMPGYYAYSQQFFRRFYTPDNAFLIVVGDYGDRAALLASIRARYGGWRGRRDNPRIPAEPEPSAGARRHLPWSGSTPPRVWIGWRVPAFDGGASRPTERARALIETAALQIVHGLAFDESAPLYQRLVVRERSVLELDSWQDELSRDPGLFVALATLAPAAEGAGSGAERAFDATIDAIQAELDAIARGETAAERIASVQQHLRYGYAMGLETPSSVASFLASMLAVSGRIEAIDEYLEALAAVTPEDVARIARTYLVPSRRYVVTLSAESTASSTGGRP